MPRKARLKTNSHPENVNLKLEPTAEWCSKTCRNLYALYEKQLFTDMALVASDGSRLEAHSCVLAAASPLFSNLLQKCESTELSMTDVSPPALTAFLKLIYCGALDADELVISEVITLAQKFEVMNRPEIQSFTKQPEDGPSSVGLENQVGPPNNGIPAQTSRNAKGCIKTGSKTKQKQGCAKQLQLEAGLKTKKRVKPNNKQDGAHDSTIEHVQELPQMQSQEFAQTKAKSSSPKEQTLKISKPRAKRRKVTGVLPDIKVEGSSEEIERTETTLNKHSEISQTDSPLKDKDMNRVQGHDRMVISADLIKKEALDHEVETLPLAVNTSNVTNAENPDPSCLATDVSKPDVTVKGEEKKVRLRKSGKQKKSLKSNSEQTGLTCSHCGKICPNKSTLVCHERVHTGERPFKCSVCLKTFQQQCTLNLHIRMQHSDLPPKFPCKLCSYNGADSKWRLDVHVKRVHLRQKTFQCEKCGQSFYKKAELSQHDQAIHLNITYKCDMCDFVGKAKHRVHAHAKRVHFQQMNHQCEICSERFFAKRELVIHQAVKHTAPEEWEFVCELCNKRFPGKPHLRIHKMTHEVKEKCVYPCPACKKTFQSKPGMRLHYHTVHLKDSVCVCPECGKQFGHRSVLKQHLRRHGKAKNHSCEHCKAKFLTKKDLNRHMESHILAASLLKCKYCDTHVTDSALLQQHESIHKKHPHSDPTPGTNLDGVETSVVIQQDAKGQTPTVKTENILFEGLGNIEVQEIIVPHFDGESVQIPDGTATYHSAEVNGQTYEVINVPQGETVKLEGESNLAVVAPTYYSFTQN